MDELKKEDILSLEKFKEELHKSVQNMTYDFIEKERSRMTHERWMENFKRLPETFVGQMIEAFHIRFENNIIYITEDMVGFLEALSLLPLKIDGISDTGKYEVYLENEPWAVIEYSGIPKNDPESHLIHFGANTQLTLNQTVKRIIIDLEIPGGEENGPSES